jgi:hypothetical protein
MSGSLIRLGWLSDSLIGVIWWRQLIVIAKIQMTAFNNRKKFIP